MTTSRRRQADSGRAEYAVAKLKRLGALDWLEPTVADVPDSAAAISNLERWVGTGDEAAGRLHSLAENAPFRHRMAVIFGASQPIADIIVKNPELGMILADPDELAKEVVTSQVIADGEELLRRSTSFLHSLDRLRYLRQRIMLRIVWNDLGSVWEPEAVWHSLSNLADGILELAAQQVWREISNTPLPVAVIALGKHGSQEVNYSSDLDLLFVAEDDADPALCEKFCNRFGRALDGKMGRGALYRVDMRLRPMGSTGPIFLGSTATVRYYDSYAEPWEIQALIRSRVCAGNANFGAALLNALDRLIYKGPRTDVFLDGIIAAKQRYEAEVRNRNEAETNIKLGPGGIRDIEVVVQMLQLTLGNEHPELKGAGVVKAIEILDGLGGLSHKDCSLLASTYKLLRQVEHRIQLRQDRQLHSLPKEQAEREILARLVGFGSWSGFSAELRRRRFLVRELLEKQMPTLAHGMQASQGLAEALGALPGSAAARAADLLVASSDSPEALLAEVREDPKTAARVRMIVERAPKTISNLAFHRELWDVVFGEQVEFVAADDTDPRAVIHSDLSAASDWESALANSLRREGVIAELKDAHHRDIERSFRYVTAVAEAAVTESLNHVGGEGIDIVALGRLGSRELLLASDWDVVLLCPDEADIERAQRISQEWLRATKRITVAGGNLPVDLRLRPEGGAGPAVRTISAFNAYAESSMEAWERMAYTRARSLRNEQANVAALRRATTGREWTWEDEQEILQVRRRVQSERMRPWEAARDLKLGPGHMLDVEWLAAILMLRHPAAVVSGMPTHETVRAFGELGALAKADAAALADATRYLARLRNVLYLLDFESTSVLPENPEKLSRIASWLELSRENEVLSTVESHRDEVSRIFREVIAEA